VKLTAKNPIVGQNCIWDKVSVGMGGPENGSCMSRFLDECYKDLEYESCDIPGITIDRLDLGATTLSDFYKKIIVVI